MPAIYLFDRKSVLGGDDLQIPCVLAVALRFVQVLCLGGPLFWYLHSESGGVGFWKFLWYDDTTDGDECRHSHNFPLMLFAYTLSSCFWSLASAVWELRLYRTSSIGYPTQRQPRSKLVEALLEFKLVPMGVLQFLLLVLGIATIAMWGRQFNRCHSANNNNNSDDDSHTNQHLHHWWWAYFLLLWFSQCSEVFVTILFVVQLRSSRKSNRDGNRRGDEEDQVPLHLQQQHHHHHHHHELVEELWANRCTSFCNCLGSSTCFVFGGRDLQRSNYIIVARALADYFEKGHIFELVPSDIVMGMMVLQKVQRQRVIEARNQIFLLQQEQEEQQQQQQSHLSPQDVLLPSPSSSSLSRKSIYIMHSEGNDTFYESSTRRVVNPKHEPDIRVLEEGAHFARYQLAIYTLGLYIYQYPITGFPRLLWSSRCGCLSNRNSSSSASDDTIINVDDWCHFHKSSLLLQAGIQNGELIYAQLRSSFHDIPYCIIADHTWKTVVLAIRGTFSIEDCITDVMVEPEPLGGLATEYGFDTDEEEYCHAGILRCARVIARDLERHGLLDQLLISSNSSDRYLPGYRLRIVGHSLGGGVGTLLSYMLRPKYPTLRCLTYGPPGYSLSWNLATGCKEWCTSFVLDSDLVPRLTLDAMDHLRDEVLQLIGRIKVSKFEVAQRIVRGSPGCWSCRDGATATMGMESDLLNDTLEAILTSETATPQYRHQLSLFRASQLERKSQRGFLRSVQLYPPGRMVHLMKTGEVRSCGHGLTKCVTCCTTNRGAQYTPVSIENNDLSEIVISPTLWFDHFPNRIFHALERVAEDYCGLDPNGPPQHQHAR